MMLQKPARRSRSEALAHRAADRSEHPEVAVVSLDHMRAVALATKLRRAGIRTATFYSGSVKAQMRRANGLDADLALIAHADRLAIRDMISGTERTIGEESLVPVVMDCIVHDWSVTLDELMAEPDAPRRCFLDDLETT